MSILPRLSLACLSLSVLALPVPGRPALAATGGSGPRSIAAGPSSGRPYAPTTSCAALSGLVARQGAVVISTGPYTYDRVVRDASFCGVEQTTDRGYTLSADAGQCFVGFRCRDRSTEGRPR